VLLDACGSDGGEDWADSTVDLRLMCTESLSPRRASLQVRCCHDDARVLRELLLVDHRYVVSSNPYVNDHITLSMRTQLAEWIYEVAQYMYTCYLYVI